ncbi:MAG: molecular chaperone TorD family protein [Pirellulaceae bacterium]
MANQRVRKLLGESSEWRLIGMLLACPQDDWQLQIANTAAEVNDEPLKQAAAAMADEASEGLYHTTFGPGGPAAPREVSHREYITPGQSLSELRAFYSVFAFNPATDEPPDHVAVEADFIAYLRLKEAYAVSRGDDEHAGITADAARSFLEDHLASIAEPLAKSLEASGITYLRLAAEALFRRVGPVRYVVPTANSALPMLDEQSLSCCKSADDEAPSADPRKL